MSVKRPDRDEYPDPSRADFASAVRRALDEEQGDKFTHHRVGRYTATQTYRDVEDRGLPPDVAKECVVAVTECERETIALFPVEDIDGVLAVLEGGGQ